MLDLKRILSDVADVVVETVAPILQRLAALEARPSTVTTIVEKGEKGDLGERGPPGESIKGDKGDPGESIKGDKGDPGESIKGDKGDPGESIKGDKGDPGESIKGDKGDPGESIKGDKGDPGESIKGEKGDKGEDGKSFTFDDIGAWAKQHLSDLVSVFIVDHAALLRGEKGEPGKDGKDGESVKGEPGESIKGEKGDKGEDGKSFTFDDIGAWAKQHLAELVRGFLVDSSETLRGEKGKDGKDGKDGESIKGDKGDPGESIKGDKGDPGESIKGDKGDPGDSIRGEKGDKGDTGEPGPPIAQGILEDAVSKAVQTHISRHSLELERTVLAMAEKAIAAMPQPRNGVDGVSITDFKFDGERRLTCVKADGTEVVFILPGVIDRGVWKERDYERGDAVSWGGSLWIAQRDTNTKPQTDDSWRLAVKKGRDAPRGERR